MNYIYRIVTLASMSGVDGARRRAKLSPYSMAHLMLNAPGHGGVRCKNVALSPTVMESSYFHSSVILSLTIGALLNLFVRAIPNTYT